MALYPNSCNQPVLQMLEHCWPLGVRGAALTVGLAIFPLAGVRV